MLFTQMAKDEKNAKTNAAPVANRSTIHICLFFRMPEAPIPSVVTDTTKELAPDTTEVFAPGSVLLTPPMTEATAGNIQNKLVFHQLFGLINFARSTYGGNKSIHFIYSFDFPGFWVLNIVLCRISDVAAEAIANEADRKATPRRHMVSRRLGRRQARIYKVIDPASMRVSVTNRAFRETRAIRRRAAEDL